MLQVCKSLVAREKEIASAGDCERAVYTVRRTAMETNKQHAHQLIEQLDRGQLAAVTRLLELMVDPVTRSIAGAPIDEEAISSELAAALDRARASIERGEGIPHDDLVREFGLAPRR